MPHTEVPSRARTTQVAFQPLQVHQILRHAAQAHGHKGVYSLDGQGRTEAASYAKLERQADALAVEMQAQGLGLGDEVAHLAFSSLAQFTRLYAALRLGVVTHLLNPLHEPAQLARLSHALPLRALWHDPATAPLAQVLGLGVPGQAMAQALPPARVAPHFDAVPELSASHVCYSSGTTGEPKSARYSHRSTVLHAWACAMPDALGLNESDRVMPLMQFFHASAWGAPFVCPLVGADLLLVPASRDPAQWYRWIEDQGATVLGAVSAHWLALAAYMQAQGLRFSTLRCTVVGGTRLPTAVADYLVQTLGVEVRHAWGMTETSPLATVEVHRPSRPLLHGRPVFGVECEVQPEVGCPVASGELRVRGHWVACEDQAPGAWLSTQDRALWHVDGRLLVIDRMADALPPARTGGVVVSASEVEHLCRGGPVRDAALLNLGDGRSALAVVLAEGVDPQPCLNGLAERLGKAFGGWRPDLLIPQAQLPYTASAKVQKNRLAEQLMQAMGESHALP